MGPVRIRLRHVRRAGHRALARAGVLVTPAAEWSGDDHERRRRRRRASHPPTEWAWRKGHTDGTILVDLERHRVLDLLPDREPDTLVAWLTAPPGIAIISRDRASAYAEAATRGAPDAIQVADRFHLLRNPTDAVQQVLERHQRTLRAAVAPLERPAPMSAKRGGPVAERHAPGETRPRRPDRLKAATRERRLARYAEVVAHHRNGLSKLAIGRRTGMSRATIIRWLRAEGLPERRTSAPRRTAVDGHADYLRQRWADGCHNVPRLWRDLREHRGFRGGRSAVRDWIRIHLRGRAPRATWRTGRVPGADSLPFRDVYALDSTTAFVLSIGNGAQSRIYQTVDGGATWRLQFTNDDPRGFFDCFAFWDGRRGVAIGDAVDTTMAMLRTTDGARWTRVAPGTLPSATPGEGSFAASGTCVTARPGGRAWLVASHVGGGRVLHSRDEGATWSAIDGANDWSVGAVSPDAAWAVGANGRITKLRSSVDSEALVTSSDA